MLVNIIPALFCFAQHAIAELDQARVAAGEDAQRGDALRGAVDDVQHAAVALPLRIPAQEAFQFGLAEAVEREGAEKIMEGLIDLGDFLGDLGSLSRFARKIDG